MLESKLNFAGFTTDGEITFASDPLVQHREVSFRVCEDEFVIDSQLENQCHYFLRHG